MKVVVVGAGVVGMCLALQLRREGAAVVLLDRADADHGASIGNAGWVTPLLCAPLSGPGVPAEVARATLRGDRYLGVRPTPGLLGWTGSFLRSCGRSRQRDAHRALLDLGADAVERFTQLRAGGVEFEMHQRGLLIAARTEHGLHATAAMVEAAREAGYRGEAEVHIGAAVRRLEPALSEEVVGVVHSRADVHVRPESVLHGLRAALLAVGVELRGGVEVNGIERDGGRGWRVATSAGAVPADRVIIAAGVPSAALLRGLGVRISLLGGKGYSVTTTGTGVTPTHAIKMLEATIACSPFDAGVRISGRFELGARDERVRDRAVRSVQAGAARYLADWHPGTSGVRIAGLRPSTPDSLPIIGGVPGQDGVYVATGHGTLGLTLAPATAAALTPLVLHDSTPARLEPFAADRFGTARRSRSGRPLPATPVR